MKVINDKYGHLQGDLAICTVAKVIKQVLKKNWIVVRYGGDEFLMVGE
jgi:diguanylate cyclase (GGDEF)-like protein